MFDDHFAVTKFKKLVKEYGVKTVVETGTFEGDSIIKIADIVPLAISIEKVWHYWDFTKWRFLKEGYDIIQETPNGVILTSGTNRVVLHWGNSPDVIKAIIEVLEEPILFYLDAHWLKDWPLHDELVAIRPRPNSLIILHDAWVPDKDFGFDTYGGVVLSYINFKDDLAAINPDYEISYNEKACAAYRGILYAVPGKGEKKWKNLMSS